MDELVVQDKVPDISRKLMNRTIFLDFLSY